MKSRPRSKKLPYLYYIVKGSVGSGHRHVIFDGLCRNTKTLSPHALSSYFTYNLTLLIMASLRYSPFSRYCHQCRTCISYSGSICIRCEKRNRIPWSDRTYDRCPTCKRIHPIADFPLDRNNYRTASCATCLARL